MSVGQWLRFTVPDSESQAIIHAGKPGPGDYGFSGVSVHTTANFVARTDAHTYVQSARTVTMHAGQAASIVSMGDANILAGDHVNVGAKFGVVIASIKSADVYKDEIAACAVKSDGSSADPTSGSNKADPKMLEAHDKFVEKRNALYNEIQKASNIANTIATAVGTAKATLGFSWDEGWANLQKITAGLNMFSLVVANVTNIAKLARGVGELKTKEEKEEEEKKAADKAAAEAEAKAIEARQKLVKQLAQYGKTAKSYGGVLQAGARPGAKIASGAIGGDLNQQQRDAGILDFKNEQKGVKVLTPEQEAAAKAKAQVTPDDLRAAGYDQAKAKLLAEDRELAKATSEQVAKGREGLQSVKPDDVFSPTELEDIKKNAKPTLADSDQAVNELYQKTGQYPADDVLQQRTQEIAAAREATEQAQQRAQQYQEISQLTPAEERAARAGATATPEDTARYSHLTDTAEAQRLAQQDAQERAVESAKKGKYQDYLTVSAEEKKLGESKQQLAKANEDFDTWNRNAAGQSELSEADIAQGAALKKTRDDLKKSVDQSEAKVRAIKAKGTVDTIAKISGGVDAGMAVVGAYNAVMGLAGALTATKATKPSGVAIVSEDDVFTGTKAAVNSVAFGGFNYVVPAAFAGFNVLSGGSVSFQSTFKTEMFSVQSVSLEGGLGAELVAAGPVQLMSRLRDTSVMGREIKIGAQKADIQRSYAAINTKLMKPWNPMKQQPTREVIVKAEGTGKIELLIDAKKRIAIENSEITVTYMSNKVKFTENEINVTANDKVVVKCKSLAVDASEKIELKAPDIQLKGKTTISEGGSSVKVDSSSIAVKSTSVTVNDEKLT